MRGRRRLTPPIGRLLAGLLVLGATVACDYATMAGTRESVFADHAQAVTRGAFEQGLVPAFVPSSATELLVRHDDRSGERWLRFQFPAGQRDDLVAACSPVARQAVAFPAARTKGLGWWPDLLLGDSEALDEQLEFFRCPPATATGSGWLAVHRAMPTAWYWQTADWLTPE
ncbi:MAG: hypothetical protein KJ066_04650 [Acidobacteria bacterium]|nr:hypothetical protein [Acidobacteriota bacterium]